MYKKSEFIQFLSRFLTSLATVLLVMLAEYHDSLYSIG